MGLQRGGRARLSLDAGHIAELVAELAPLVEGRRVTACVAALPRDVVLLLEGHDESGAPERLRLRLSSIRPSQRKLPAPNFCSMRCSGAPSPSPKKGSSKAGPRASHCGSASGSS